MQYTVKEIRYAASEPMSEPITGPHDIKGHLAKLFEALPADRECFVAVAMDTRGRIIAQETVSIGTANTCLVHPREVFRFAVSVGAVGLVVAHNHPSGSLEPSEGDIELTDRLRAAGELLGIPLHDHIIHTERNGQASIVESS